MNSLPPTALCGTLGIPPGPKALGGIIKCPQKPLRSPHPIPPNFISAKTNPKNSFSTRLLPHKEFRTTIQRNQKKSAHLPTCRSKPFEISLQTTKVSYETITSHSFNHSTVAKVQPQLSTFDTPQKRFSFLTKKINTNASADAPRFPSHRNLLLHLSPKTKFGGIRNVPPTTFYGT